MDNDALNNAQVNLSKDAGEAAQKTVDEAEVKTAEAFEYQPPEITIPEQPAAGVQDVPASDFTPEVRTQEPAVNVPVQQPVQQQSGMPPITQQYYQYTPVNPALISQQSTADGFAVASLICAVAGLFSCCTVFPSILAVIFGAISKAKNDGTRPTGMSTAGLILGIIGIILNLIILLFMFSAD